ncbi:MAG TPA: hypothetical protein VFN74_04160 [Chloroflexota bacterium]|nr:hypothetical protein [Chloroflexota bacterium]
MKRSGPVPGSRKGTARKTAPAPEKPSDDPEALRQLHAENIRKASEALRALKLPNDVEPCVVFKP